MGAFEDRLAAAYARQEGRMRLEELLAKALWIGTARGEAYQATSRRVWDEADPDLREGYPGPGRPEHARNALATPEGRALSDLVEAALAWRDESPPAPSEWADMTAAADLADAVDRYREALG